MKLTTLWTFTGKSGITNQTTLRVCVCCYAGSIIDLAFWSRENHFSLSVFLYIRTYVYFVRSMCVNANGENRYGNECWLAGWLVSTEFTCANRKYSVCCFNALDGNCIRRVKLFVFLCFACVWVCVKSVMAPWKWSKNIIDFFSVARTHIERFESSESTLQTISHTVGHIFFHQYLCSPLQLFFSSITPVCYIDSSVREKIGFYTEGCVWFECDIRYLLSCCRCHCVVIVHFLR